eukprot:4541273-Alexandrium_andersonii.AAC.1
MCIRDSLYSRPSCAGISGRSRGIARGLGRGVGSSSNLPASAANSREVLGSVGSVPVVFGSVDRF